MQLNSQSSELNEITASRPKKQPVINQSPDRVDALTRLVVWGPVGVLGALGKPVPTWLRFVTLGASLLQIARGWHDLRQANKPQ